MKRLFLLALLLSVSSVSWAMLPMLTASQKRAAQVAGEVRREKWRTDFDTMFKRMAARARALDYDAACELNERLHTLWLQYGAPEIQTMPSPLSDADNLRVVRARGYEGRAHKYSPETVLQRRLELREGNKVYKEKLPELRRMSYLQLIQRIRKLGGSDEGISEEDSVTVAELQAITKVRLEKTRGLTPTQIARVTEVARQWRNEGDETPDSLIKRLCTENRVDRQEQ